MNIKNILGGAAIGASLLAASTASAALVGFQSYTGNVAMSTDGFGSSSGAGTISASALAGSTVVAAYLYTATYDDSSVPSTVTLNGTSVTYSATMPNATACCNLRSHRADVTSIVAPVINGGAGGVYNFDYNENNANDIDFIDGSALVVVYRNPALPVASVGILDGFASVTGDTTSINFANPLDPDAPGFFAEMILGIGFSCCDSQRSTVTVNGDVLTENAGNFDDGLDLANGSLFTVGSFDDPISAGGGNYENERERYDLSDYITAGDTTITVDTFNASQDDNIFLAGFYVSGVAGFNEPPPSAIPLPAGGLLLISAMAGLGLMRRRKTA